MKFQPGQSGNPAGRPLGARNKKTIAREEALADQAAKAVERIVFLAEGGHPTAMRICADWAKPGGNSRALALELPRVTCADDAQKAFDMVVEAFGEGAITVREFSPMLGSVDRMARIAERIQQNRERERERYGAQRVHGVHPDMIPKAPPGWTDPLEALKAAIERGEDPFPDDPVKSHYVATGERLYSPVNSDAEAGQNPATVHEGEAIASSVIETRSERLAPSLPRERSERGEGGERSEPGGGAADAPEAEALYSPVNLNDESAGASPPPGAADAAPPSPCGGGISDGLYFPVNLNPEAPQKAATDQEREAIAYLVVEAATETLAPSLPRAAGEGGERSEPGGGLLQALDLEIPERSERDRLYLSVNSEHESAGASPPPGAADAAPPSPCGGGMPLTPG
jgi:Family of unknown function (DUF5681)